MSEFFDMFFIVVVVSVAILTAVDWLLGHDGRERMKQLVGNLWTTLQYATIDELIISSMNPVRRALNNVYGKRAGWRLVIAAFITNWITVEILASSSGISPLTAIILSNYNKLDVVVQLAEAVLVSVFISGWVPFKWLISTFNSDIRPEAALREWSRAIGLLVAKITGFSFVFLAVFSAIFAILSYSVSAAFAQIDISMIGSDPDALADLLLMAFFIFFAIGMTVSLPVLLAISLIAFLLFLRVFQPWLQPITSLLLERLYQSEQGVLTQVAIGLGFIAKLTQEILKYTGAES